MLNILSSNIESVALMLKGSDYMTYEEYEKLCKIQQEKNEKYLEIFEDELIEAGLSPKTIKKHLNNIDFYINEYLLKEQPLDMQEGCGLKIDDFLGYFFIHKCMWSTTETIKTTAASLKKFYKCMEANNYVSKDKYKIFKNIIKENMEIWQQNCDEFNNYY